MRLMLFLYHLIFNIISMYLFACSHNLVYRDMQEGEFELPPNIYKNLNDKYLLNNLETNRNGRPPAKTLKSSSQKTSTANI